MGGLRGGFLGEDIPLSFSEKAAKFLERILHKKKLFDPASRIKSWPKEFEKMVKQGHDKKEIKSVLKWYADHIQDKYVPQSYCASTFRKKYLSIRSAMTRQSPTKVEVVPDRKELSEYEKTAISDAVTGYDWPKTPKAQVEVVALESFRSYRKFFKRMQRHKESLDQEPFHDKAGWPLPKLQELQLLRSLESCFLSDPLDFCRKWWATTHPRLHRWKEWTGDLRSSTFSPDHKAFHDACLSVAKTGGWTEDHLHNLLTAINAN